VLETCLIALIHIHPLGLMGEKNVESQRERARWFGPETDSKLRP